MITSGRDKRRLQERMSSPKPIAHHPHALASFARRHALFLMISADVTKAENSACAYHMGTSSSRWRPLEAHTHTLYKQSKARLKQEAWS